MIKFETINETLCRMVEPEPLQLDSPMPCVVRLIQDDSRLGILNKLLHDGCYHEIYLCTSCNYQVCHILINDEEYDDFYPKYEIIGYPVEEGSKDWALYQMMQGEKVFRVEWECDMYCQYTNNEIITFCYGISSTINPVEEWIANAKRADFGWQIYKEPETDKEPIADCDNCKHQCTKSNLDYCQMYEPKPTFKVGDWVEWCGDQYMVESAPPQSGGRYDIRSPYDELGCSVYPENITRKLSPSEIVVRIGCLSGTIEKSCDPSYFLIRHSSPKADRDYSIIRFSAIDTQTHEFVESLLKAQEEKK